MCVFFIKQKTAYEMRISDWSSDVCSSDLIVARFLPFAVLLGTLITLVQLNQNSEVVIFKSGGISAHQILAPLMIASLGVALVSFVFNERVLTRANRTLDAWPAAEYGSIPRGSYVLVNVWVRDGHYLIHAAAGAGH